MDELLTILEEGLPFQKTDYEKQKYIYRRIESSYGVT